MATESASTSASAGGDRATVELNASELELVLTALRFLASTLGREEADELAKVQALIARLEDAD
jgi:hypothetical protein